MISAQKLRRAFRIVVLSGVSLSAAVAIAHHSSAMYDYKIRATYEGTVSSFRFSNPHSFVDLDVPTKDGVKTYSLEMQGPSFLKRFGWTHNSLKQGDKIKVTAFPLKDGRAGGALIEVTYEDGKKLSAQATFTVEDAKGP